MTGARALCAVCMSLCVLCFCVFWELGKNHGSNLSARILCVGDIKVLISTVTQHQCHCEDTNDTSTVCVCVCACEREGERV